MVSGGTCHVPSLRRYRVAAPAAGAGTNPAAPAADALAPVMAPWPCDDAAAPMLARAAAASGAIAHVLCHAPHDAPALVLTRIQTMLALYCRIVWDRYVPCPRTWSTIMWKLTPPVGQLASVFALASALQV